MLRSAAVTALSIGLGGGLAYLAVGPAWPHQTASGMIFDARCCRGNSITGDCQPIPASSVTPIDGGLQITLAPGDHPLVTRVHVFQIEQGKVLPSTDGRYYACLWPSEDHLQCLYAPPTGF